MVIRTRSGCGPAGTGLQTRSGPDRRGRCAAGSRNPGENIPPSRWKVPRNWVTDRRRRHSGPAPAARRKGRVSNDAMPASEKPTTGRSAMLLHSLQSALLFGVFETAQLIGRLGTPLLFLGELSGRQSRRLSPVELVTALVGHRLHQEIGQRPHESVDAVRGIPFALSAQIGGGPAHLIPKLGDS